jgi:hypothetical protein
MTGKPNGPQEGDVFLSGDPLAGFHILNAISLEAIAGPLPLEAAIEAARVHGGAIWQQTLDNRGRPLGDPFRLLRPRDATLPSSP